MPNLSTIETPNSRFLDRAGLGGFPWFTAIALYTISYGWFWNVRNSYWADDWESYRFRSSWTFDFGALGFPPWFGFHLLLHKWFGPAFLHLLIFCCFFLVAVFFYGILKKVDLLNFEQRKFATLLFLLLPFNSSRVTLMTFFYTIAYLLFFLGWYLIVIFKSNQIKVCAVLLFFLSFQMHSLPVFFALPILHLLILDHPRNWRGLIIWARNNSYLILVSPLYWTLRWWFWNSTMTGYHNPSLPQIWMTTRILLIPGVIVMALVWTGKNRAFNNRNSFYLIAVSMIAVFVGLAPYIVYGAFHGPVALRRGIGLMDGYWTYFLGRSQWNDRHLMLQPLGFSMLLISALNLIPAKLRKVRSWLRNLVIGFCVLVNVCFGFEYLVTYSKQQVVISELKNSGNDLSVTEYKFIDRSGYLNVRSSHLDSWGILGTAYGFENNERLDLRYHDCVSADNVRLVVIDGEKSLWKSTQNWLRHRNFGISVEIFDGPVACTADLVSNFGRGTQIPFLFYLRDQD